MPLTTRTGPSAPRGTAELSAGLRLAPKAWRARLRPDPAASPSWLALVVAIVLVSQANRPLGVVLVLVLAVTLALSLRWRLGWLVISRMKGSSAARAAEKRAGS